MTENPNQPPTKEQGVALANRMWKLLGSKTRHYDQRDEWSELAYDAWNATDLTWERFTKIAEWALVENEYTVENLRISRTPGRSLFVTQWENIQVFYDAAMAKKAAVLRKKGKHICPDCEMAEVSQREGMEGRCEDCAADWHRWYTAIKKKLVALAKHIQRETIKPEDNAPRHYLSKWTIYWEPEKQNPAVIGHFIAFDMQSREHRVDKIVRTLMDDPNALAHFERVWELNKEKANDAMPQL